MLISKGPTVGGVVTLKLVTGEEIIGKLESDSTDDMYYGISRPLTLVMSQKGIGLQPWLFTVDTDKTIKFPKDKVMIIAETMDDMSKSYLQGTTGIALS